MSLITFIRESVLLLLGAPRPTGPVIFLTTCFFLVDSFCFSSSSDDSLSTVESSASSIIVYELSFFFAIPSLESFCWSSLAGFFFFDGDGPNSALTRFGPAGSNRLRGFLACLRRFAIGSVSFLAKESKRWAANLVVGATLRPQPCCLPSGRQSRLKQQLN